MAHALLPAASTKIIIMMFFVSRVYCSNYSIMCYNTQAYKADATVGSSMLSCDGFINAVVASSGIIDWTNPASLSGYQKAQCISAAEHCCTDKKSFLMQDYSTSCNEPALYTGATYTGSSRQPHIGLDTFGQTCDYTYYYYWYPCC